jgi:DNA-binding transcriptional ArsR family regulator
MGERTAEGGWALTRSTLWGDAAPLPGCDVIRVGATERTSTSPPAKKPSAVVRKLRSFNRFLDRTARTLAPTAVVVWILLLRDERGGSAATAVADLARRAGVSEATAKRHLKVLRERGLAVPVRRGRPGVGPTRYRLHPVRTRRVPRAHE